jgi:hypothetical protein
LQFADDEVFLQRGADRDGCRLRERACSWPRERSYALGPIFRTVFWHSIARSDVIGVIALLQAYVFPGMIPIAPLTK